MEVIRDRPSRTIRLSQKGYLEKVLQEFGYEDCRPVSTPMETSPKYMVPAEAHYTASLEFRRNYQSAVGSLT